MKIDWVAALGGAVVGAAVGYFVKGKVDTLPETKKTVSATAASAAVEAAKAAIAGSPLAGQSDQNGPKTV